MTALTGGVAIGGMSVASVGGGALAGAVGSALGSPLQGIGNAIYFGDEYSARQWGTDVLVGGVAGGIAGGIAGLRNNARWAAKGLSKNSLLTGKELPSTDALGNVVPDGFTAQFPEYSNLTPGGRYTYSNPAASATVATKGGFSSLAGLGLKDGMKITSSRALELGEKFLGKGYKELVPGSGRYLSADGTRVFRMGINDITGAHGGGPHVNFETLIPNPAKVGKMMVDQNFHIYLTN